MENIKDIISREQLQDPETKAEFVSRFSKEIQAEDVDGYMFGVDMENGMSVGVCANPKITALMIARIIVANDIKLDDVFKAISLQKAILTMEKFIEEKEGGKND